MLKIILSKRILEWWFKMQTDLNNKWKNQHHLQGTIVWYYLFSQILFDKKLLTTQKFLLQQNIFEENSNSQEF